ncbi:MAG TPA: hypothetical protein P5056_04170 [Candidatus Paceibacterota bacterium]|nr:hypothetical protein [Candidatus Paceibacterota bacterium]
MKGITTRKIKKIFRDNLPVIVILSALILLAFYYQYAWRNQKISGEDVIYRVGKMINLPADEVPTIATVTNLEPLKDNVFFTNAKLGDTVLIYAKSAKAILFRTSENRIIEIGSLNIGKNTK